MATKLYLIYKQAIVCHRVLGMTSLGHLSSLWRDVLETFPRAALWMFVDINQQEWILSSWLSANVARYVWMKY